MFGFFSKKIEPEALWAYKSRIPDRLEVRVISSEQGGYTALIETLPGCVTEADDFAGLTKMVNYAVYDYLKIPEEYFPYLHSFNPPPELVAEMKRIGERIPTGIDAPKPFQEKEFVFAAS